MVAAADKASVVNVTELCTGHGDKCANTTPMWGAGWGGVWAILLRWPVGGGPPPAVCQPPFPHLGVWILKTVMKRAWCPKA